MTIDRNRWLGIGMNALVILLAASIPFGFFMGFYTDNSKWFLFCLPLLIFLS